MYGYVRKQVRMNHINVSVTEELAPNETVARLESFFREFAPEAEMTFALRNVTARFTPLGNDRRAFAVAWQPVAPGPFPAFAGTLFISPVDANERESILTLDGHYHPPLGVAGDVFDAFVGKHIAQASATDLLERISQYVDVTANAPVTSFV
jgi:hypothetical protein